VSQKYRLFILNVFLIFSFGCNITALEDFDSQSNDDERLLPLAILVATVSQLADSKLAGIVRYSNGTLISEARVSFNLDSFVSAREESRLQLTNVKSDRSGYFAAYLKNGNWTATVINEKREEVGTFNFKLSIENGQAKISNSTKKGNLYVKIFATKLGTNTTGSEENTTDSESNPVEAP
jgi:hypothetical protein